ncbi:hypothetical protein [Bacillus albus]|uniref:hypothetical protein n=1 Tax=Bacillus albus TaxID=2026189 RepID=UPI003D3039F6
MEIIKTGNPITCESGGKYEYLVAKYRELDIKFDSTSKTAKGVTKANFSVSLIEKEG